MRWWMHWFNLCHDSNSNCTKIGAVMDVGDLDRKQKERERENGLIDKETERNRDKKEREI